MHRTADLESLRESYGPIQEGHRAVRTVEYFDYDLWISKQQPVLLGYCLRDLSLVPAQSVDPIRDPVQSIDKTLRIYCSPPIEFETAYHIDIYQISKMDQISIGLQSRLKFATGVEALRAQGNSKK